MKFDFAKKKKLLVPWFLTTHSQSSYFFFSVQSKMTTCWRWEIAYPVQDAKKIFFTACHSGKLKLAFTSPDLISTSPKSFLTSRIDFTVLVVWIPETHHPPIGHVKNRIHKPNSKIHLPRAIGHYFLCTLLSKNDPKNHMLFSKKTKRSSVNKI